MDRMNLTRRDWLAAAAAIRGTAFVPASRPASAQAAPAANGDVRDVGSRRELFVDRFLIDKLDGTQIRLHEPQLAPLMTVLVQRVFIATMGGKYAARVHPTGL